MYTLEQLSNPETYKADKRLFGMARTIAESRYSNREQWLPFKNEITDGKHPQLVMEYLESLQRAEAAEMDIHNMLVEEYKKITPPTNVTMQINGQSIYIFTAWDGNDLGKRLSRKGAHWDRDNRRWVYPLDNVTSLPKIFANWQKSRSKLFCMTPRRKELVVEIGAWMIVLFVIALLLKFIQS